MRHFLFEDKDYKIRADFKRKRRVIHDPVLELARILRNASKRNRAGSGHRTSLYKPDLRQKCVAKMQYSNSIEAHLVQLEKYLIREGTNLDGSAAELFGTESEEYRKNMADKNYRIFLSPQTNGYDLRELAETFIAKLEKQTGYRFYWQGACHYNTPHHHAHLLINGVDKSGKKIEFRPPDLVKTFMRETARDLCTAQRGLRTKQDLDREREQELYSARFIKLDDVIQKQSYGQNRILPNMLYLEKERILTRLETLRRLNLCVYENGGYTLKKTWQEDLRANGRYNTFLKAREQLMYTDPSLMSIYSGAQGQISGKVTKIYRTDGDASNSHAVILESLDGKAYYIPLLKKPDIRDKEKKTFLKEGEMVSIKTYQAQQGRLTPVFFKREIKSLQKEIGNNNYSGRLAVEIKQNKGGGWNERQQAK